MDCIKKVLDSSTVLKELTKDIKDLLGAVENVGVVEQEIAAHKGNNKVAEQIRITRGSNPDMAVLRELVEGKGVRDTAFSYKDAGIGMLSDKLKSTLASTLDSVKSVLGNIGTVKMDTDRSIDMVKAFMARDNVQVAVAATIEDYVASSLNELAKPIDYYEFIEDMGLRSVLAGGTLSQLDEWTKSIRQSAAKGGKSAAFVADELGKQLLVNLGVPTSKLVDEIAYKNLVTKLGGNMLQMMVARGLIEPLGDIRGNNPNGFMPTPWTVAKVEGNKMGYAWVRPTQSAKDSMKSITDNARTAQQLLEDELGMTIDKREPMFRKPREEITKVRRQPFSVAKPHLQEAINNFQQVGWIIHDKAVELLEQLYTTPEELAVAMGRPELNTSKVVVGKNDEVSEVVLHSRDEAESIRAQQSAIDDTIKYFKEFVAKVNNQEAKKFYFKWFIARNERAMIDSNTVNPQNDKQLARWLMIPDTYKYVVDSDKMKDLLGGAQIDNSSGEYDAEYTFLYGIVQAFDGLVVNNTKIGSIDNRTAKEVLADADVILQAGKEELIRALKASNNAHLGHALLAIVELENVSQNGTFETVMTMEVDGLTNGLAFKMVQFPLATGGEVTFDEMMQKTGVGEFTGTMAEWKAEGVSTDIYQTLAKAIKFHLNRLIPVTLGIDTAGGKVRADAQRLGLTISVKDLADGSKISSELRKLAKSPTMVFGYGAGIKRIVKNYVEDKTRELGDRIARGELSKEDYEVLRNSNAKLEDVQLPDYAGMQKLLRENVYDSPRLEGFVRTVEHLISQSEGYIKEEGNYELALEYALNDVLGAWQRQNDLFNGMFDVAFRVFEKYFQKKVEEIIAANGKISEQDKIDIAKEVIDKIPALVGYKGNRESMIVLIKDKAFKEGTKSVDMGSFTLMPLLREYASPAASAGPVGTHSLDSAAMTITLNRLKDKHGVTLLSVFDASVGNKWIGEFSRMYNEVFAEINREYSLMDDATRMLKGARELAEANGIDLDSIVAEKMSNGEGGSLSFAEVEAMANGMNDQIQSNRKELFSRNLTVGQMVGYPGTTYRMGTETNEDMGDIVNGINGIISGNESVKRALSQIISAVAADVKDKKILDRLNKLAEGCK